MTSISQKEYLKKYLSSGKKSNRIKKKKKPKSDNSRLKIIDDDIDLFSNAVQEDLLGETEDAPQIVAIIDDRPPSLRVDEKSKTHLWIPVGNRDTTSFTEPLSGSAVTNGLKINLNPKKEDEYKNDYSPPRRNDSDEVYNVKQEPMSPCRNIDISSVTEMKSEEFSHPTEEHSKEHIVYSQDSDGDISPPRKSSKSSSLNTDISPPRRCKVSSNRNSDTSPPRRSKPMLPRISEDMSPPRRSKSSLTAKDEDRSPPRRYKDPSKQYDITRDNNLEVSSHRKHTDSNVISSIRNKKSRWNEGETDDSKMKTTLDGKKAGLQNAKDLVEETIERRQREDELFSRISRNDLGANASTIVRDRKTGRIRNEAEEISKAIEKKRKDDENKEKYMRWGKGIKQVEDANVKRAEELKEMSKPLARYADDEDLEKFLKEQEWEGDPMAHLLRKKKKKKNKETGEELDKPSYMGDFMPNRFRIKPGHRWDGVDRSNGYEKKWFEVQNSKLAQQDESYKWSTEDM